MSVLVYVLEVLCLLLCLLSAGAAVLARPHAARRLFDAVWLVSLLLLVADGVLAQALPFGNMRHVLAFFPVVMVPAAYYLRRWRQMELIGWLAWASALAMAGALCMPLQASWRQMPALQSPWFVPHVTSYVISYGLLAVAAMLVLVSCVRPARMVSHVAAADALVYLAFPFMTFGLGSGALWADAAWGGYWAWDIKEVWSLLSWTLYIIYLHLGSLRRNNVSWRRPLLLLGFLAVLITFLVVNLLPKLESMHSYAQ